MSTHNYLDKTGLGQVWEKIKNLTSRKTESIPFGQVDDTSTATAFTAAVDGITELRDGVCVYLKNGVITSASGWTLNINNLGAKPVYQTQAAASRTTTIFNVAYTGLFVYNSSRVDGGCWDYFYGYNSDTNTTAYQVRANQTINEMHAALTRYKICFTMFDGTILPSTSVSNSTATTKTLTTEAFDPYGAIYYYNTTTGIAAGESPSASYMWLLYPVVDLRYGFNAGSTLVAKDNVYIKCSPQSDGSVKLSGDDCIVQALPNTDDGYVYIYLGKAYDTYRMSLDINHPIYYYKDGAVRLWANISNPDLSNYLSKTNTTSYTPSGDYNPATKKYVDDVSQPKDLIVTISAQHDFENSETTYSADKTFSEVISAINNNTAVYFVKEGDEFGYSKRAYAFDNTEVYAEFGWGQYGYIYTSSGIESFPDEISMLHPDVYTFIGGDESEIYGGGELYGEATSAHNKGDLLWVKHDVANTINLYIAKENIAVGDQFGTDSVYGNIKQVTIEDCIKNNSLFAVTVTSTTVNDVTTYSADKTFAEITEAYESGKNCIVIEQSSIYVLSLMASTGCCFTNIYANNSFNRSVYKTIHISSSDVITIYNKPFLTTDGTHNVYSNKKLIASVNGNFNTTPVTGSLTYSTTAYKAYEKDDLFWKDNTTLAKATTDIASGGTLTENTNYVSTTISDELKDIRASHLSKTNTTAYIPTADYNPATKKYVDDNNAPFVTTVTSTRVDNVTTYSADKTFTEITNAYNDGKDCICKIGNMILELVQVSGSKIIFALAYTNNFDKKLSTVITIQISNSNEVTYALKNIATTQYVDEAVSAAGAQSDWNENDTTSSSYIQNRTHYKTSLGYDLHLNLFPYMISSDDLYQETFTVDSETISTYFISEFVFANSDIYDESYFPTNTIDDFDLSLSSSILVVDGVSQTLNHVISRNDSYFATDVIFAYNNEYVVAITNRSVLVFHNTNTVPTSSLTYDLKLSNEIFEYNTLDKRYLNGELIIKGPGIKSEIFNGLTYEYGFPSKESLGNYSHIEGEASGNILMDIFLSGQAGATTYSLQYFNFNRYGYVILDKELYAYEDNIEEIQPTGIYITSYSSSDGTITLSSTLNADSDISGYNYYLPLPLMYASSDAHAEGKNTYASGYVSHAEGDETVASGQSSHAEGNFTIASGNNSHAEGQNTTASDYGSHAEGTNTVASSQSSHAEGGATTASGAYSHAEGGYTTASGNYSHAEGYHTTASGIYSHAKGYYTEAQRRSQHVFGEYNILDTTGNQNYNKGSYIEIVGNGTSGTKRSNARTLDWSGNEVLAGKLTVGVAPTNDMDVATKKYVDDNAGSGGSSTLVDLTDTTISSPTNGQVLMYNSTSGKWENTSLPIYNGGVSS